MSDDSCEACYSGRRWRWFHLGVPVCWVCRWVRWPLIRMEADRLLWLVDHVFDRKGGIAPKGSREGETREGGG